MFVTGGFASFLEGLALFFVNFAVFVDVVFLKEFRKSAVSEGFFVSLDEGSATEDGACNEKRCEFHEFVFFEFVER